MDSHSNADWPGRERIAGGPGGRQRPIHGREGDEECIALGIDLHPTEGGEGPPQNPPMLGQGVGIRLRAQRMEEPGRALDISEQGR
jgi:hypothetical protein